MKEIELQTVVNRHQIGGTPKQIQPNICEDTIFLSQGERVGFYIKDIEADSAKYARIANHEFLTSNVPKSLMRRASGVMSLNREVRQYSTIIGGVPAKAFMRRPSNLVSSIHSIESAQKFIKAMCLLATKCSEYFKEILPLQYQYQRELIQKIPEKFRLTDMFTSSITNFNISAAYHIDKGNLPKSLNMIVTKRSGAIGGCLHIPEHDLCIEQADSSLLVYPAWKSMHGVTPIIPTKKGGYRNTLIFYSLAAFLPKNRKSA